MAVWGEQLLLRDREVGGPRTHTQTQRERHTHTHLIDYRFQIRGLQPPYHHGNNTVTPDGHSEKITEMALL